MEPLKPGTVGSETGPATTAPSHSSLKHAGAVRGVLACVTVALAATFVSEHYGGSSLLYALLLGLSFHFLWDDEHIRQGVGFCATTVLRAGIALMGVRVTAPRLAELGLEATALVIIAVTLTLLLGLALARVLGRPREEGILSAGSVAICGASAAMAIASVLPQTRENERYTLLAVIGVTVMSTLAMIIYPVVAAGLNLDPLQSGLFFGGTIHDVAQVAAAGQMVSPHSSDTAMIVKLFRVLLLVPLVMMLSIAYRRTGQTGNHGRRAALVPGFLLAFIALAALASSGTLQPAWITGLSEISRWMLVTAIGAAGIKTSLQDFGRLGWPPITMLVTESLFIAAFVLVSIRWSQV